MTRIDTTESHWDADMPAYKRLRKQGLQPKSIDGCAELESKANSQFEIDTGHLFKTEEERKRVLNASEQAKEIVEEASSSV